MIEAGSELTVTIMYEKAYRLRFVAQTPNDLPGLLGYPSAIWTGGTTRKVDTTGAQLDEKENVKRRQANAFDTWDTKTSEGY